MYGSLGSLAVFLVDILSLCSCLSYMKYGRSLVIANC